MMFYQRAVEDALAELGVSRSEGLSSDEAARRLRHYGLNTIRVKGEPLWRKILEPFMNIFAWVLIAAALLSAYSGHHVDAIIVSVIIFINATIYYVQQYSTERVLRSLRRQD